MEGCHVGHIAIYALPLEVCENVCRPDRAGECLGLDVLELRIPNFATDLLVPRDITDNALL